jgi:hypothetical protein
VTDAVNPNRPDAGIAEEYFKCGTRSWIAFPDGRDIFANSAKYWHRKEGVRDQGPEIRRIAGL